MRFSSICLLLTAVTAFGADIAPTPTGKVDMEELQGQM